jgi:hypothetical protein
MPNGKPTVEQTLTLVSSSSEEANFTYEGFTTTQPNPFWTASMHNFSTSLFVAVALTSVESIILASCPLEIANNFHLD